LSFRCIIEARLQQNNEALGGRKTTNRKRILAINSFL